MQKKLLLIFMAVNCFMVQAESSQNNIADQIQGNEDQDAEFKQTLKALFEGLFGKNEDIIAAYKNNLPEHYQAALAKELSGEKNSIEKQFTDNELANKNDEDGKKKYLDDSQAGYWSAPATKRCVKGYIEAEWAALKTEKDKINKEFKQTFNGYRDTCNALVMPVMEEGVVHINYEMEKTFSRALGECGDDKDCLLDYNVHWPVQESFLNRLVSAAVKPVIKVVLENNIPLTETDIFMIAQKKAFQRGERSFSLESAEESKKKVVAKVNNLLNPKKNDEDSSSFLTDDRRD